MGRIKAMKIKMVLICITICTAVALTACGKETDTNNSKTETVSSIENESQTESTGDADTSESVDEISQETFTRLAAENKELWKQVIALQYEEHKKEVQRSQEPDLEYDASNVKRHQEMAQALKVIQDINDGRTSYEDVLAYTAPDDVFTDIEVADFEEVSDEDLAEAIAEVKSQNAALKSLIDAMSHDDN